MTATGQRPGRARRYVPGRDHQVKLRYTAAEYALLTEAAHSAGLTPSGFAAECAIAAARGVRAPSVLPLREALLELIAARTQVRRFGININQAVRSLNATGQAPEWLYSAAALTCRAVDRLDAAAAELARASRRPSPRSRAAVVPALFTAPTKLHDGDLP